MRALTSARLLAARRVRGERERQSDVVYGIAILANSSVRRRRTRMKFKTKKGRRLFGDSDRNTVELLENAGRIN